MTNRGEYKKSLSEINRDTRLCFLYLEELINDKHKSALNVIDQIPRQDLSSVETKLDSLQKQIDGLRVKSDALKDFVETYEDREKFIKELSEKADKITNEMLKQYKKLYDSGYFTESTRRQIRESGLTKQKTS